MREDELNWLRRELGPRDDIKVLDIGCGNGAFLAKLAPRLQSAVGIDISEKMLEQARKRNRQNAHLSLQQVLAFFPGRKPTDLTDPRLDKLIRILTETANVHNAATFLAEGDDWDFLAVYLDTIDHACHGFIEYHPPAMAHVSAEDAATYGYVVRGMYRFHDMMLARLLAAVGPETTVRWDVAAGQLAWVGD